MDTGKRIWKQTGPIAFNVRISEIRHKLFTATRHGLDRAARWNMQFHVKEFMFFTCSATRKISLWPSLNKSA